MREFLLRKSYGIPVALLALLALAGVATALILHSFTTTMTLGEPLTFTDTDNTLTVPYQGGSDNLIVNVANHSTETSYGILVDADVTSGQIEQIKSVTYSADPADSNLFSMEATPGDVNGDADNLDAQYNIGPTSSTEGAPLENYDIKVSVTTTADGTSGSLTIDFEFLRKAKYTS